MLEVCVDSLESARNALIGGAGRLEVCSSLNEGGLTPTAGLLKAIKNEFPNAVTMAMLRCRSGADFCYSDDDLKTMLYDLETLKSLGADGFVFGALDAHGSIDNEASKRIAECAFPLPVTFHRAFDACTDPYKSLEDIIDLKYNRILTSGQQSSATKPEALVLLKNLLDKSCNRIIIMAGAGVDDTNVCKLRKIGIREVHGSFKTTKRIFSSNKVRDISIGQNDDCLCYVTDVDLVNRTVRALSSYE